MKHKLTYTLSLIVALGVLGVQAQEVTSSTKTDTVAAKDVITKHGLPTKVTAGSVTFDLRPLHVEEEAAIRAFMKEKKASFVESEEDNLENVGTTFTAKRVLPIVITDEFVQALQQEANARVEAKKQEPWTFPEVDTLKQKLEGILGKTTEVKVASKETTERTEKKASVTEDGDVKSVEDEGTDASDVTMEKNDRSKSDTDAAVNDESKSDTDAAVNDESKSDKKKDTKEDIKAKDATAYAPELLWTDKDTIFLHKDVHVGATRGEVLFAWGAPKAMWRNTQDGSMVWLYQGIISSEKTITESAKSSMQKEEFSRLVKNSYSSDSLAGSNSSVGYVWLSLAKGKVAHLGMIKGEDWPRFAIPATTLETFIPNEMKEADFSLMGYRLGTPFTNDPNRSWEEKGKLYGQEFLGYKDVVVAYNKDHEITLVMINSSLGTTKRGISLGDSKYLLLYLYGVPDFEEPANHHDPSKGTVYGYRHPLLANTYLLFTVDDKFIREILLSTQKKSELVSAMK